MKRVSKCGTAPRGRLNLPCAGIRGRRLTEVPVAVDREVISRLVRLVRGGGE